jgi:chromate transporter
MAWTRDFVVQRRQWCSEDEFAQALAVCQLVPGANTLNMAAFLGSQLRGTPGALAALTGLTLLPFMIVLGLGLAYGRLEQGPGWQGLFRGLGAGAAGVALGTALQMGRKQLVDRTLVGLTVLACLALLARIPMLAVVVVVLVVLAGEQRLRR